MCAYLPVRVPVRCGGPVLPTAALVPLPPVPPARTPTCPCWSRSAANAVPSCLSPWTPCDNTVATKEENLRRKPPVERRTGEHREKRAPRHRPATKSNFKRTFCEVNVGRAHRHNKWKPHAPQTAVNERSSMTSAQTTPTQGSDHRARQR